MKALHSSGAIGMDLVPDIERLTQMFNNAIAPAFFLGAVAAFLSLLMSRLASVHDRIKAKRATDAAGIDLGQLRRRAALLNQGIMLSLGGGVCATLLLAVLFATQFFGGMHPYGAGLLFFMATLMLGVALARFAEEAWLARRDWED